jgi:hypothetical protein
MLPPELVELMADVYSRALGNASEKMEKPVKT